MANQCAGEVLSSLATSIWSLRYAQLMPTPANLGVRAGVSLFILLIALLLGPRIARSVRRVPALIETARERHTARLGAEAGATVQGEVTPEPPREVSRWLGGFVLVCIWAFAIYLIGATWFADTAIDKKARDALLLALRAFALDLGISLLITLVTLVVARALQKSLVASLRHRHVNNNLVVLAGRTIFAVTLVIGLIAILSIWGLGIVLPVTLIGAATVALTLSLQDVLKNVVSGIYLLVERPFVIGDQITIVPYTGIVENIYIRVTALRTTGGERVLVPNGMLFSSAVVNKSFYQRHLAGVVVTLPDNRPDAIEAARERILAALADSPLALRIPAPTVTLSKASGGTVDLRVAFWLPVTRAEEPSRTLADVMEQIRAHLPEVEVVPLDVI